MFDKKATQVGDDEAELLRIWCKADRSSVRKMTFFQSFFIVADTCRRAVDCVFNFVECDTTEVRDCRKGGGVVGVRQSGKRLD